MLRDTGHGTGPSIGTGEASLVQGFFTAEGSEHLGWNVTGATITTSLNRPYLIVLDIETDRPEADPAALFAVAAEMRISRGEADNSYGGIISSVRTQRPGQYGARAKLTLEPALAALRHGRDTRIFQDMSVPEVLDSVLTRTLAPYGRTARQELRRSYPKREYTVQYQESDFAFIHRLMEEEGILYHFVQDGTTEVMILIDGTAAYPRLAPSPVVNYSELEGHIAGGSDEYVHEFDPIDAIGVTQTATRHFDWTHPSAIINGGSTGGTQTVTRESYEHDEAFTLHSYAMAYQASDVGDQPRVRREMRQRAHQVFRGRGSVSSLRAGARFELTSHPDGLDGSYVVTSMHHYIGQHVRLAGHSEQARYQNVFEVASAEIPWRPQREHARPRMHGIQTAIVTGPPGEEIHCDEWGRVKVQFHWDREGRMNEQSSCWLRVSQTAAGSGFGAWVLPRVGWEVLVSFIDGDPDRPLVTGCVYNGDQPLPYPLPAKKALTLFKSNSYPGGNGFNELRLDDTKHAEEIFLHGEKDWNTVINHDHTRTVGHDETQSVGHDRTRNVGNDETLTVGHDRTRNVGNNETVTVGINETRMVGVNRSRMVGVNETIAIGAEQSTVVGASRQTGIGANDQLQVAGDRSVSVAGNQNITVGVNESYKIGKSRDLKIGKSSSEKVGKTRKLKVGIMDTVTVGVAQMINVTAARMVSAGIVHMVNAGMMLMLNAGKKIELKCGGAKISMSSSGKIEISGSEINIKASGNINQNGAMIHLN